MRISNLLNRTTDIVYNAPQSRGTEMHWPPAEFVQGAWVEIWEYDVTYDIISTENVTAELPVQSKLEKNYKMLQMELKKVKNI